MEAAPHPWPALGVLLLRDGLVEKHELEEILSEQRDSRQQRVSGRRLGEILIQRGRVTPNQVAKLVAEQYEIPFVDFDVADIDVRAAMIMSEDDARRLSALPIGRNGDGTFLLAIADPSTVLFSDELRRLLDSVPRFAVVGPDALERAITHVFSQPHPRFTIATELAPSESADDLIVVPSEELTVHSEHDVAGDAPVSAHSWPPLGALLLRDGLITDEDLETALAQQRLAPSLRLGEILTGKGLVPRAAISRLVAEQYELPFYELDRVDIDPAVASRLPEEIAWQLTAVPIAERDDGSLQVAIADPTRVVYSDDLHRSLGVPLDFVVASPDDVEAALDRVHEPTVEEEEQPNLVFPSAPPITDVGDQQGLDVTEPPHLVVEAGASEAVDTPTEEDDSSWATRLELVEQTVSHETPEHVEHDVRELTWEPIAEIVFPEDSDEDAEPATAAEVIELIPPEEPETDEADVYEFSWPPEPEGACDETSLVDDLSVQVAEAMLPDVVEVTVADEHVEEQVTTADTLDIFGIGSWRESQTPTTTEVELVAEPTDDVATPRLDHVLPLTAYVEDEPEAVEETEPVPRFVAEPESEEPAYVAEAELELEAAVEVDHETEMPGTDFETAVVDALTAGATVIHFSPRGEEFSVRARVDGLMRDLGTATPEDRDVLVQRLESDGVARTHVVETSRGSKTTVFIRERAGAPTSLDELGLSSEAVNAVETALRRQSGAVLVCGPAGSGTTTTLYAMLGALATPERVVATVEYPVERLLEGIDQIEVAPSSGVTFAGALRDLSLTDTDAVLVGNLPDLESAIGALGAAYEGRLVVAGFRARSASAAVLRLADMGVEPTTLASSLGCVVSQRLVRTVCADCREPYYASDEELAALGQSDTGSPRLLVRGTGCDHCAATGFRGRTAIFEVMPVTDELRGLIADGASAKKLQKAAVAAGMRTLRDEGVRLCLDGLTTVGEVVRVLGDDV